MGLINMIRMIGSTMWKQKVGVLMVPMAFFWGMQFRPGWDSSKEFFQHYHNQFDVRSYSGKPEFQRILNQQGHIEQVIFDRETGERMFSLAFDGIPINNDYTIKRQIKRIRKSTGTNTEELYNQFSTVLESAENKMCENREVAQGSIHPSNASLYARTNEEGKLESILQVGNRTAILTMNAFNYTEDNSPTPDGYRAQMNLPDSYNNQLAAVVPISNNSYEKNNNTLPLLTLLTAGAIGVYAIRKRNLAKYGDKKCSEQN